MSNLRYLIPLLLVCMGIQSGMALAQTDTASGQGMKAKSIDLYNSAFSKTVGKAWSTEKRQSWAGQKYWTLGPFVHEPVQLTLKQLPQHEAIEVQFRLVILGEWTGNRIISQGGQMCGPNFFSLQADQKLDLIFTTFSNTAFDRQSYPGPYRSEYVKAKGQLVDTQLINAFNGGSVYEVTQRFWHQDDTLTLDFQAMGLGLDAKRQWALLDIQVKALQEVEVKRLAEKQLVELLKQLEVDDPHKVALAQARMAMMHPDTLQTWKVLINQQIREQPDISALIEQLAAGDLETRQQAMNVLRSLGAAIAPTLHEAIETAESLEQRDTLMLLLGQIAGELKIKPGNRHAMNLLKRINRPESKLLAQRFRKAYLGGIGTLEAKTRWEGLCYQEGRRPYRMVLRVDEIKADQSVHGEMHWPELRNSKSRFKGKVQGMTLTLTEYELFQGNGIIIPVDYQLRLVHEQMHGFWHDPNNKSQWGYIQLRPVVYRE